MRKRIYINEWLELKPYNSQVRTDGYYLKLSNEVKEVLTKIDNSKMINHYFGREGYHLLSCFLTSYFEDVISGTNIWNSFVILHKKMYGKFLPFYDLKNYIEEEINIQDVQFLIWYFFNTVQEEKFISPYAISIIELSIGLMDVFENEWEYAPENEDLKKYYEIDEKENDFYKVRNLIDTVLFKSYLFWPDTLLRLEDEEISMIKDSKDTQNLNMILNQLRDNTLNRVHTRLLALKGKDWVATILGDNHLLSKEFSKISNKIEGLFFYKGQDKDTIFIEHIASGKEFNLKKESYNHLKVLKEINSILFMGIIRWKEEWWFSGISFVQPFNSNVVKEEKNSFKSRREVDFLDFEKEETKDVLTKQYKAFKDYNGGSPVAFLASEKVHEFYSGYIEFYNKTINLSDEEQERFAKKYKKNSRTIQSGIVDFTENAESALVFFNPKSGCEIALNVNSAFPTDSNPYFKEEESLEHIQNLLMNEGLSTELAMYCVDNYGAKLTYFKSDIGLKILQDLDFLLRFWKKNNYHSKPSISFTS